jgi:cell division cycle 20-like protein 1 (cofactor of APC complex)
VLAVGLGMCVYLWNATTSKVTKLCDLGPGDSVTSVNWTQRGTHVAVGTNNGSVLIWDAEKCRKLRTMNGHTSRVGKLKSIARIRPRQSAYLHSTFIYHRFTCLE